MSLMQRHVRHLSFVRETIGGAFEQPIAAFLTVSQDDQPAWAPLAPGAASLLDVHERTLLALGYRRKLGRDNPEALDRLEVSMVRAALGAWLPRLGEAGERVKKRMEERGLIAVNHHLIHELAMTHGSGVLEAAGTMREVLLALDTVIDHAVALDNDGPAYLSGQRVYLLRRLVEELSVHADTLGSWDPLVALWFAALMGLGTGGDDITATRPYTIVEQEEVGAFDLVMSYEASLSAA